MSLWAVMTNLTPWASRLVMATVRVSAVSQCPVMRQPRPTNICSTTSCWWPLNLWANGAGTKLYQNGRNWLCPKIFVPLWARTNGLNILQLKSCMSTCAEWLCRIFMPNHLRNSNKSSESYWAVAQKKSPARICTFVVQHSNIFQWEVWKNRPFTSRWFHAFFRDVLPGQSPKKVCHGTGCPSQTSLQAFRPSSRSWLAWNAWSWSCSVSPPKSCTCHDTVPGPIEPVSAHHGSKRFPPENQVLWKPGSGTQKIGISGGKIIFHIFQTPSLGYKLSQGDPAVIKHGKSHGKSRVLWRSFPEKFGTSRLAMLDDPFFGVILCSINWSTPKIKGTQRGPSMSHSRCARGKAHGPQWMQELTKGPQKLA